MSKPLKEKPNTNTNQSLAAVHYLNMFGLSVTSRAKETTLVLQTKVAESNLLSYLCSLYLQFVKEGNNLYSKIQRTNVVCLEEQSYLSDRRNWHTSSG